MIARNTSKCIFTLKFQHALHNTALGNTMSVHADPLCLYWTAKKKSLFRVTQYRPIPTTQQ